MTEVVAALISRDGRFLICQRAPGWNLELHWEFPGGKIEEGETPKEALVRECREELGTEIAPGRELMQVEHFYPDQDIHLTFFAARIASGEPQKIEHKEIRWITADDLIDYRFCPADESFVAYLRSAKGRSEIDGA